jgi:hypothetical protein
MSWVSQQSAQNRKKKRRHSILQSFGGFPPLFGHFDGSTQPSDNPPACVLAFRLMAFSNRPAAISRWASKLYDRTSDDITLDEVERIAI